MTYSALLAAPEDYGLLTDLYQLTMVSCYAGEGIADRRASFELFTRRLPNGYGYLIAMGLAQAIEYLNNLRFSEHHLEALRQTGLFDRAPAEFWQRLENGVFTGDVWAVPEGTAVFANQPLLRVEAPLWQAQLAETYLLNTLNYQTLVATRAARLRDVAGPTTKLLEFGTRRAFSPQGALWAARAALAAGLDETSNVLAALELGRRPAGTMAHALVMVFAALEGHEDDAFKAFQRYFPGSALLIDTYDTLAAAKRLAGQVPPVAAVRLDSGDLVELSKAVRSHLPEAKILASGDLDEYEIARLRRAGAAIDGYGLGTKLVTGDPVNGVYKLVDIDGVAVMKESSHKTTLPGRKQIFRRYDGDQAVGDRLGLVDETAASGEQPLLQLVVKQGQPLQGLESLDAIAARTAASVASLPLSVRQLEHPATYEVALSNALEDLAARTRRRLSPLPQP
ncbi:nicotinate phosphoribosyltransferase [Nodosilinea sp. LEGE 06152]|uniref:nicotinate phosphoribosyltransferase n=1 Tax=Nodosilinea sp. LEGE 06152 TaxID=2777966 RepID=UPI00188234D3|nr:nicotinate phosphoribosyltransferase [Nodosilinea sp. LEGE 06152]MBE9158355.1 nicotinate phosphoribosyltransferase [Nodosilinea sp. LEGE 06152]